MSFCLDALNRDFKDIVKDIQYLSVKLSKPMDRVRTMHWIRKLSTQNNRCETAARIRNEYAHFLRLMLLTESPCFAFPFKSTPPPPGRSLAPLCESLANNIASQHPKLPKTGPIRPVMCHKSPDGRAYISIKQGPEGGLSCYMAVCTDPMNCNKDNGLKEDGLSC